MTTLLLLQTLPDTVVTLAARDGHDLVRTIAAGAGAVLLLAALVLVLYVGATVRRVSRAIESAGRRISADPAVANLRTAAANLQSISETLRDEAAKVTGSATHLADRLNQASDRIEERIEDFNALIEVMQQEAEGAFLEGAATARGLRAGLGAYRNPGAGGAPSPGESSATLRPDAPDRED